MSLKKILIILIILFIFIASILLVYNFFSKEEVSQEGTPQEELTTPDYHLTSPAKIQAVSQGAALGAITDGQKIKYYSFANGNVFQSNFDGSETTSLSSAALPGLLKVLWSPNKNKVIAIFEENNQIKKYFYSYSTGLSVILDKNISWIDWSPKGDKIAYQYYNPQTEDNNISLANPDGSQWTNILATRMKNLIVEWPTQNMVSIQTRPSGLAQSVLYTINLETGNFEKIIPETYGLTILWSPLGDKLLFSETDNQGKNLKLKIADLTSQTIKELNFVTLPEKCTWSQDNRTLFCAVPKEIPNSAVLPDDYYQKDVYFTDDFWRINLDTQEVIQDSTSLSRDKITFDAKELLLSPLEDYLFFVNRKNERLYSLKL